MIQAGHPGLQEYATDRLLTSCYPLQKDLPNLLEDSMLHKAEV